MHRLVTGMLSTTSKQQRLFLFSDMILYTNKVRPLSCVPACLRPSILLLHCVLGAFPDLSSSEHEAAVSCDSAAVQSLTPFDLLPL